MAKKKKAAKRHAVKRQAAKRRKAVKKPGKAARKPGRSPAKKEARPKIKRMARKALKKFKALLLKEREEIGGDLNHIAADNLNKSQRDASGDLSGYSYHMADMASDNYEREFSLGRATDEQKILFAIDEALKRVEDGTYGSCQQCSKPIAKKRLMVVPHAELCIECQKKNESK
ncbi:MAG: TraR/DksA C4-type zinc finger protein [Candidatus Omnitrophica bacterium]|nr:TraR/DksA C4-type zinc finger protein [Candidatus Omnitrophota bacterium]